MAEDEQIVATNETVEPAPDTVEPSPADDKPEAKTGKGAKAKEPKAKKPAAARKARTAPTHPPYEEVCYCIEFEFKFKCIYSQFCF